MNRSVLLQVADASCEQSMPLRLTTTTNNFFNTIREQELLPFVFVFLAYFFSAKLGQYIFFTFNTSPALLWPAAGISLAAVLLGGYRMWVPIALAQLLFALSNPLHPPALVTLTSVVAFTLAPVLGAFILRYFGFQNTFSRTRDALLLIAVALIIPILSSALLTETQLLVGNLSLSWFDTWSRSWAGRVFSILVLTPAIITSATFINWRKRLRNPWLVVETIAALLAVVAVTYIVFWTTLPQANIFLTLYAFLAVLFWIGLRLGTRVMAISLLLTTVLGIMGSIIAHPSLATPLNQQLFADELFIILFAPIYLILAALVEERRRTAVQLSESVAELKGALEKLGREDESKNEFIATLAHELRNPLAPIVSTLEYLKLEEKTPETYRLIESAEEQTNIMRRLLDDLLEVARITQKHFKLHEAALPLQTALTLSVDTVKYFVKSRRHILDVSLPEAPMWIYGDSVRLAQIFTNILFNAAKYTPEGGHIVLEAHEEGGDAIVSISDTGVGIDVERLKQIFEPFLHTNPQHTVGNGLGIGLSLTKRLVEMHHGAIEARSPGVNKGSTFMVRIPLSPLRPEEVSKPFVSPHILPTRFSILIVDDNKAAAEGIEKLLTRKGHSVVLVYDGETALATGSVLTPDIVLLDIGLPDIDGYEVARRLRQLTPTSRLVALTGYGQDEDKVKAQDAGFNHHLTKPVGLADIESVLDLLED